MAGQVLAVASGKGGVGKTTTVVNLGVVLRRADHSVVLVDADLGMANLDTMLGITAEATIHDVLAGRSTVEDALVEEAPGFGVLAGSTDLSSYPDADPRTLGEVFETLAASYDYVIVDTGAGMSHEDVLPLGLADRVILVTSPDPAAVGDTRKTAELAGLAEGAIAGLLVNKADESTDAADVAARVGVTLLGVVPFDVGVRSSTASATPLEAADPDGPAAAAYRELGSVIAADGPPPEAAAGAPADGDEPTVEAGADDPEPEPTAADDSDPAEASDSTGSEPADEPAAAPDEGASVEVTDEEPSGEGDSEPADEAATPDQDAEAAPADAAGSPDRGAVDGADEAPGGVESAEAADDGDGEAETDTADEGDVDEADGDEGEVAGAADDDAADEPEQVAADSDEAEDAADDGTEAEAVGEEEDENAAGADDEDDEDLDDYLEEFEDIEPDRSGGFFSRLRRLFR